ncbi:Clas41 [Clostera anastomosis granulovirus B]|uniref:Clas41 n=1 Tax=Clostera anastomosis granulovirus B TaxID=1986290 RepID=A0A0K0WS53_9BBAC|nr:Clas41 [Clostera anastomosis granulovirus B]AKS25384.1 Clas41 [Clostera anastomosis granulovirus B]
MSIQVVILAAIVCVIILYVWRLNRGQEILQIQYKHKFIPLPLAKYVNNIA